MNLPTRQIASGLPIGLNGPRLPAAVGKALADVEGKTLVRSAEIQGIAYVGQTALSSVTQLSMAQAALSELVPEGARLRLAGITDVTTAAIQARLLDLLNGL